MLYAQMSGTNRASAVFGDNKDLFNTFTLLSPDEPELEFRACLRELQD